MALEPPESPQSGTPGARDLRDAGDTTDTADLDPGGLVTRAVAAARQNEPEPPGGWAALTDVVMSRVRGLLTLAEPVLAHTPDGRAEHDETGSRVFVSARVVVTSLRRLLQGEPTHAPESIRLDLDDDGRLVGLDLTLVAAYGVDLLELGDRVRHDALTELVDLVGPPPGFDASSITVTISDVVDGDPNRV